MNPRKEFFRVTLTEIRAEVERLGIPTSWTMAAECRAFRESQAMERALATDAVDAAAWGKRQLEEHDVAERGTKEAIEAT